MSQMKYINSNYRVIIGHDAVHHGIKDAYSWIEIHFLETELDCRNESLVLAFGETLKAAIKRSGKNTVEWYNRETCMKDKCLKMYLTAGVSVGETEDMLLDACEIARKRKFDKSKQGEIYELIFRHGDEIRECAYDIEEAILIKRITAVCIKSLCYLYVKERITEDNENS